MTERRPVTDFATDWDHTDPAWVADPYPIWADLRERCPVAHTDRYGGGWFPTTHAGVSAIAHDTQNFTSREVIIHHGRPGDDVAPAPIGVVPPISSDPPFHAIARRLILPALAPGVVRDLEPRIREICASLAERMGGDVVDLGTQYAEHIPPAVISRMLGFPPEDEDLFREFVHVAIGLVDLEPADRAEALAPMIDYFIAQVEDHRVNPRDDLTTYLLNAEVGGETLAIEHVFGTMVLVLIAGIDTTWSAIGASLWHLAGHPEDRERLVRDPGVMPFAIEEFLRYYAPVTMARLVKHDMEYLGCPMREDDWILLGFPAANRDPTVFADADRFVIDRRENRHLAFGLGVHRCAGSNLARLELRVAIEEFLRRFPRFELADPTAVTWAPGQIRGPRRIPVRIL